MIPPEILGAVIGTKLSPRCAWCGRNVTTEEEAWAAEEMPRFLCGEHHARVMALAKMEWHRI